MKKSIFQGINFILLAVAIIGLSFNSISTFAQTDIFQMMERTDLTLQQTEAWADTYFAKVGTGHHSDEISNRQFIVDFARGVDFIEEMDDLR